MKSTPPDRIPEFSSSQTLTWISDLRSGILEYAAAVLIVIVVAVACIPSIPLTGYRTVSLVLLLVVSILPLRFGRGPVLLGAGVAALAWDFLYLPPVYTFAIGNVDDVMMLGVFFAVAAVTGVLTGRIRNRERAVTARERRTAALFALTNDLSSAHSQNEVIQAGVSHIRRYFGAEIVVYLGEPDGDMPPNPHPASTWIPPQAESRVAAWTYWNEKKAGRLTNYHPGEEALYLPMTGPRYSLGVVGVRLPRPTPWPSDLDSLLTNFIAQIGVAAERELLNDVNKQTILVTESERLYRTLFNSISHELRTPIAAILGSVENLLGKDDFNIHHTAREHLSEIQGAAQRLNRLVANLLDMSRLESGLIRPKSDWCDVRDVINAALKELQKDLSQHSVRVTVPEDFPLLRADFGLLEQALINLIHNATVHTPVGTRIDITVVREEGRCFLTIADTGPGIAARDLGRVFEKFYRAEGSASGGTGLGLPIARGFIEAQGGMLTVQNRKDFGVEFMITLPLKRTTESA